MRGHRVYPDEHGNMPLQPGDYGELDGEWWVRPPRSGASLVAAERITEHEDGTISVYGLLELPKWRGYLVRGIWTEQ